MAKKISKYNGYYRKRFTVNGKTYTVYGKSRTELFEKETAKREEIEKGYTAVHDPTLNQYYKHFSQLRKATIKESTIRSQQQQFNMIAGAVMASGETFGELHIKNITRRNIEDIRQQLIDQGKSPEHLNTCFAHLNHVFNNAVIDDTIIKNPCKALKPLKRTAPAIGENRHRALTEEETKMFFKAAAERNSYYIHIFELLINTGLRIGELTALTTADIDYKSGFMHITKSVTRNTAGGYEIGSSTKTESGERDIPITAEIKRIIREQQQLNELIFGYIDISPDTLIFRSFEGEILREYQVNREIKRICQAAGVEYFTCHSFRNTYATRFIEQRPQDYKILSELLGHKDIKITLNLYTHVMTENKVEAANSIIIKTS